LELSQEKKEELIVNYLKKHSSKLDETKSKKEKNRKKGKKIRCFSVIESIFKTYIDLSNNRYP
jgi:hypothetical protein